MASSKPNLGFLNDHEHYFELCAVATSGTLTDQEWKELRMHLSQCQECRMALQQYREVARTGIALLMPDTTNDETPKPQESWSTDSARAELFTRLLQEPQLDLTHSRRRLEPRLNLRRAWQWVFSPALQPALRYAAEVMLLAAAVLAAYQIGTRKGQELKSAVVQSQEEIGSVRAELKNLMEQRAVLDEDLKARSIGLRNASGQLRVQTAEVEKWKTLQNRTAKELGQQAATVAGLRSQYASAIAERDSVNRKLQESEAALQLVQSRYDRLREQRSAEMLRVASLEDRIQDLSVRLNESDGTVHQQQQFLAQDRDIRELMGARKLYIADVYDVNRSGETQKPYGRVFYTAGKSLIFYAFDLDQQPTVRNAGIFQAWGRRGMADKRPLNMGIFYLDSESNKRWVLKFDDPRALAQIDAVFVTVEPRGGSRKPSGKQLLFASLRTVATNHP